MLPLVKSAGVLFTHGGLQVIEVITVVNMIVEVKNTKDYEKKWRRFCSLRIE